MNTETQPTLPTLEQLSQELLEATRAMRQALLRVKAPAIAAAAENLALCWDKWEAALGSKTTPTQRVAIRGLIEEVLEQNRFNLLLTRAGLRGIAEWVRRTAPKAVLEGYGADGAPRYQPVA